jgi:hypothetical protein
MADDLSFATAALGNSVAASNASTEAVEKPEPLTITPSPPFSGTLQQPPPSPPATILNGSLDIARASPTMRGDVQLIRS